MKELYLLRHGSLGQSNKYIGKTDLLLTEQGIEEINKVASTLRTIAFQKVFCSPLSRCRQSLDLLNLPAPSDYVDDLREIDFGRWEGKDFSEISRSDEENVRMWATSPETFCFPEGESIQAFRKRIEEFYHAISDADEEKILIVSHGGVIRHLLCFLLNLSPDKYLMFSVQTGTFSVVEIYTNGGILTGFNLRGQ